MKDKFINSNKSEKLTVHVTMIILIITLLILYFIYDMIFLIALFVGSLCLECLFIVWSIGVKKSISKNKSKLNKDSDEEIRYITKKDLVLNAKNVGKYINYRRIESFEVLDDLILIDDKEYILNNKYSENLCFCENIDRINLLDVVSFKHEEDNKYDKDTIGAYVGDNKIGLLFKGSCRNMLIDSVKYNKYKVKSFVYYKSTKLNRIGIKIGYYSLVNDNETIITSLLKIDKKDKLTDKKRSEEILSLQVNDKVILEKHIDNDRILVLSQSGNELGEINESVSNNIINNVELLRTVYAKVISIDVANKNVTIKVYIQNNKKVE